MRIILHQQEQAFCHIIKRAEPSILNRKSPAAGLAPIHFAVLWPVGLRMLMERGVNVNIEDDYGRRPIHLAVASGLVESVRLLLNADCGLFTPAEDYSLLQYALELGEKDEESQILLQVSQALYDRHNRLREMAISHLPPSISDNLNSILGVPQEQHAPFIMETLVSHGIDIPSALELDGKGFFDFYETVSSDDKQITPKAADVLWSAGFHLLDEPNDSGWTPFLQSCFCHNFEMIDWFASRGVRLDSRHTDVSLTALHLYAKGMRYHKTASKDISAVKKHCIQSIQKELGIPYDDCTCICSPTGCTPGKFILENDSAEIRELIEDLNPPKPLLNRYVYHLTRHILFDLLGGEHTCCSLGQAEPWMLPKPIRTHSWRKKFDDFKGLPGEHYQCCNNGLPVPRVYSLRALKDPDVFSATLNSAMSHYDEMNRPDTMPADEQVYAYINWILKEGYLDIDVSNGCEHDGEPLDDW